MAKLRVQFRDSIADDHASTQIPVAVQREVDRIWIRSNLHGERLDELARNVATITTGASAAKADLNREAEQRAILDEELLSRTNVLTSESAARARGQTELREDLSHLRSALDNISIQVKDAFTDVGIETSER